MSYKLKVECDKDYGYSNSTLIFTDFETPHEALLYAKSETPAYNKYYCSMSYSIIDEQTNKTILKGDILCS